MILLIAIIVTIVIISLAVNTKKNTLDEESLETIEKARQITQADSLGKSQCACHLLSHSSLLAVL